LRLSSVPEDPNLLFQVQLNRIGGELYRKIYSRNRTEYLRF